MGKSITEAKRIVTEHGIPFKIYYRDIAGRGSLKLEDLESSFQDNFIGRFNNKEDIVNYYLSSSGIVSDLSKIQVLNFDLSHFLDYDRLFGELEYYYNIYLCSETGMYYVFYR
jgi:antirestriction protein